MNRYIPINTDVLDEQDAHVLFQEVANHYLQCAGNSYENAERVDGSPSEVLVVWRLWIFLADVGGSGVCDYLSNYCHEITELKRIHSDLTEVGAVEMKELLEAAIRLTVDTDSGEYLDDPGAREWSVQFARRAASADDLNSRSMELAEPASSEVVATFIRAHKERF